MKFAILALLSLSLQANTITFSTSVGAAFPSAGVDLEITVQSDGSVTYGQADLNAEANWSLGIGLATTIPSGATINSATLRFTDPVSFLTPEGAWPVLTADVTATVDNVTFGETGCSGTAPQISQANPSGGVQFVPCSDLTSISPLFSGSAQIDVSGWTTPTNPGTYENTLLLNESIGYSLTVDYTPAPQMIVAAERLPLRATPEPATLILVGAGLLVLIAIGAIRIR